MKDTSGQGKRFLDAMMEHARIRSDSELARQLGLHRSTISYIRSGERVVSDTVLLAGWEKLNIPVTLMRDWLKGE